MVGPVMYRPSPRVSPQRHPERDRVRTPRATATPVPVSPRGGYGTEAWSCGRERRVEYVPPPPAAAAARGSSRRQRTPSARSRSPRAAPRSPRSLRAASPGGSLPAREAFGVWSGRESVTWRAEGCVRVKMVDGAVEGVEYRNAKGEKVRYWTERGALLREKNDTRAAVGHVLFDKGAPREEPPCTAAARVVSKRLTELCRATGTYLDRDSYTSRADGTSRRGYALPPPPPPTADGARVPPAHWPRPWRSPSPTRSRPRSPSASARPPTPRRAPAAAPAGGTPFCAHCGQSLTAADKTPFCPQTGQQH
eukprot:TRINITY_DN32843_c0_g1_i1.p1 TRINITY_DN32843_c0_g1~~TRINITY_DN32843_c0_g1_i1.p1  ORF type:complete len:308 (+),score=44.09 TRINITY_DN32843_c0_g1_i1:74-997(+)